MSKKSKDSVLRAFIAVFFSLIGFFIALILWRKDKYVMHYASESLVLFISFVIASVIDSLPLIGKFIGPIFIALVVVLWVISWINALSGEMRKTWIIGDIAEKIEL